MAERTWDVISSVRKFDKPDLCITFTHNTKWREIRVEVFEHQEPKVRHDIIAGIFIEKQKRYLKDGHIYDELQVWKYTTEWQKRSLPH